MNALAEIRDDGQSHVVPVFCLRQRDATAFWDGATWVTNATAARSFYDLDQVLGVARRTGCRAIDLVVLFLSRERSLVIPLG